MCPTHALGLRGPSGPVNELGPQLMNFACL